MKLWVDDIRNAPDESWSVVRTVNSAIKAIDHFYHDFSEISLDHDISHQVTVGTLGRPYPCEETFMAVAYYLKEKYLNYDSHPKITIHSSNVIAAQEMAEILTVFIVDVKPMGLANRLEMETK